MNAKELAQLLEVHPETIRKMIRDGDVKAEKKGRSYVISEREVQRLKNSKGTESLAKAQVSATMQLIVNLNSEIEGLLANIQSNAEFLNKYLAIRDIHPGDHSLETFEKRRRIYEEEDATPLRFIVENAQEIKRVEFLKKELQKISKENEEKNTIEKANKHYNDMQKIMSEDFIGDMVKNLKKKKGDSDV